MGAAAGDRAWPRRSKGTSSSERSFRNRQRSFRTAPGSARTCTATVRLGHGDTYLEAPDAGRMTFMVLRHDKHLANT